MSCQLPLYKDDDAGRVKKKSEQKNYYDYNKNVVGIPFSFLISSKEKFMFLF
jgi:hypothetical protein